MLKIIKTKTKLIIKTLIMNVVKKTQGQKLNKNFKGKCYSNHHFH